MEYFVKVWIKSKEDLPEKHDRYLTEFGWAKFDGKWTYSEIRGGAYLRDCNYWLKPVEIPEISDEEIEKEAERLGEREDSNKQKFIDGNYFEGFIDCAKWYREELKKRMTK